VADDEYELDVNILRDSGRPLSSSERRIVSGSTGTRALIGQSCFDAGDVDFFGEDEDDEDEDAEPILPRREEGWKRVGSFGYFIVLLFLCVFVWV